MIRMCDRSYLALLDFHFGNHSLIDVTDIDHLGIHFVIKCRIKLKHKWHIVQYTTIR